MRTMRPRLAAAVALVALSPPQAAGQQVTAPEPRDDPEWRTKVGGGCDTGAALDSLLTFAEEVVEGACDPTKSCCGDDWVGPGSTAQCSLFNSSAAACEAELGCSWVEPPGSWFSSALPATCKADLTQNCCGCENVSPDGRCGTWTSVCFMCTGTVAEDACPEACAFDIFKWRTGIDFLDDPLVSHGPIDVLSRAAAHPCCRCSCRSRPAARTASARTWAARRSRCSRSC